MAITINGLETRFLKPKGGENPFKSAKPFDDNIDYNSLEDGDLFYIELKGEFTECGIETASVIEVDSATKDIIRKISSNGRDVNAWGAWLWPPGVGPNIADITSDDIDWHTFIVHAQENVNTSETGPKTIGVFILPQLNCSEDITNIPTHLGKKEFEYWRDKLPTIILGEVSMFYSDTFLKWSCILGTELVRPCLIGNLVFSFEVKESATGNFFELKLENLLDSHYLWICQMMPIYFLLTNSNDYRNYRGELFHCSFDMNTVPVTVQLEDDSTYTILTDVNWINTGNYAEHLHTFFTDKYDTMLLSQALGLISYYYNNVIKLYLLNSKFYSYAYPGKIYILYNNGVFSSINNITNASSNYYNIMLPKYYLKIIEYFENNPESSKTLSISDFIQLFNIKPIGGNALIASLLHDGMYGMYISFPVVFSVRFVDKDHVEISLVGGYSNSSSSQELLIGEFEE